VTENVTLADSIFGAIGKGTASLDAAADEDAFQLILAGVLGDCERELRATFAAPSLPPRCPPPDAITQLASRRPPRRLVASGRDPCAIRARLDILWHSPSGCVPIELKYCSRWKADTNGYQFLKDLHRLERMKAAGSETLSDVRFAAFATNQPVYWRGERPEPPPFWLTEGRRLPPGYWVQYDQASPDTLWYSYPPFFLSNEYHFRWRDLHADWKCLLVETRPQLEAGVA